MSNNSNKGLYYNFILEPLGMYSAGSDESVSQMSAAFGVRSAINDLARFNPKLGQILQLAGRQMSVLTHNQSIRMNHTLELLEESLMYQFLLGRL